MTNQPSWNNQFYKRIEKSLIAIELHVARVREFVQHLKIYNKQHSNFAEKNLPELSDAELFNWADVPNNDTPMLVYDETQGTDAQDLLDALNKLHPNSHNIIEKGGNKQDGNKRNSNQQD